MKFRLSTVILSIALLAVSTGWLADHLDKVRIQNEAAGLAAEFYRVHTWLRWRATFSQGALFHPETSAIMTETGDVIDLGTTSGRSQMVQRIDAGDSNFRVKMPNGLVLDDLILKQNDSIRPADWKFPKDFTKQLYPQ